MGGSWDGGGSNRQALRETIQFLLLQLCGSLFTVISINIPFPIYHVHGETDVVSITLLLYPCSFVLLPLLLLCQSHIIIIIIESLTQQQ